MDVVIDVNPLRGLADSALFDVSDAGSQVLKPIRRVGTVEIVGCLCAVMFHDGITVIIVRTCLLYP